MPGVQKPHQPACPRTPAVSGAARHPAPDLRRSGSWPSACTANIEQDFTARSPSITPRNTRSSGVAADVRAGQAACFAMKYASNVRGSTSRSKGTPLIVILTFMPAPPDATEPDGGRVPPGRRPDSSCTDASAEIRLRGAVASSASAAAAMTAADGFCPFSARSASSTRTAHGPAADRAMPAWDRSIAFSDNCTAAAAVA